VELVEPQERISICDPACGSGGMLIESRKHVQRSGGKSGITGIMKDMKMMALFITVGEKALVTTKVISQLIEKCLLKMAS
jgi:type I restriction-modification system DNA methylase subunit